MAIISSNWLDYLNSFVRTECENIIIMYNGFINMISNMVENYLYLIRWFNLFPILIFKLFEIKIKRNNKILFLSILLSVNNINNNNNLCYRKNRLINIYVS